MKACEKYTALMEDWFAGALSNVDEAELKAHVCSCPSCQAEYHSLQTLETDLIAIGNALGNRSPVYSLSPAVMSAVAKARQPNIRPHVRQPRVYRRVLPWISATAALAATIILLWSFGYRLSRDVPTPIAKNTVPTQEGAGNHASEPAPPVDTRDKANPNSKVEQVKDQALENLILKAPDEQAPKDLDQLADLTFDDVLAARRDAFSNPESRAAIAQWASLTIEQARKLASGGSQNKKGELGAAMMLPPAESQPILVAAVHDNPQDPYLRYRLATSYSKKPETTAKAAANFSDLATVDSDNALNRYQLAAAYFAQGDTTNGLAALQEAQNVPGMDTYTSDGAAYREQALLAAGAAPDVARALSALTAGNQEYGELASLGNQLLEYGRTLEQNGDEESAQQIYEAVRSFGMQLTQNASYSSEEIAGLDIERAAVGFLSNLVSFMQSPEHLQMITEETQHLLDSFASVNDFLDNLNETFTTSDKPTLQSAINFLFQNGDLGLLNYLRSQNGH